MGANTQKINTAPAGSDQVRGGIIDYLNGPGGFGRIGANNPAAPQAVGVQSVGPVNTQQFGSIDRGQVRDVTANPTQSVDQLGGANSAFFQNMMNQLAPSFNMQRQLAMAAGKEAGGNLTGSGYANAVGNNLNRTLGDQQATLANYALQGLQTEVGRQSNDANRALSAGQGNQSADLGFLNQFLTQRGQNIGVDVGNADRQQNTNDLQANLTSANNMNNYNQQMSSANSDANRFLQLLMQQGQPFPNAISTSGGAGALLGPIGAAAGGYFGNGGSLGGIGSWLGSLFGGGAQGSIDAGNKTASGIDFGSLGIPGMNMQTTGAPSGPGFAGNPNGGTPPGAMSLSGGPRMNVMAPPPSAMGGMTPFGGQPMVNNQPSLPPQLQQYAGTPMGSILQQIFAGQMPGAAGGSPMMPGPGATPSTFGATPGSNPVNYGLNAFGPYTPAPYTGNGITSGVGTPGVTPSAADPSYLQRLLGAGSDGGHSTAASIGGMAGSMLGHLIPGIGQIPVLNNIVGGGVGSYVGKELGKAGGWLKSHLFG